MEFEQKIEIITLEIDGIYQSIINVEQVFGWEVVSSSVSETEEGKQMLITFRRNKLLKRYERLKDLESKVKRLRKLKEQEQDNLANGIRNQEGLIPLKRFLSIMLLVAIIVLDIYIIGNAPDVFVNFDLLKFLKWIIFIVIAVCGHYFQNKWSKNIRSSSVIHVENEETVMIEEQIKKLISEAKSLDHSIKEKI